MQSPPEAATQDELPTASRPAIRGQDSSYKRKRTVALIITVLVALSIPALILALVLLG
ncbi:hypothetical protein [Arthrobacter sp. H5]|uniref:hypothetical protein n=1 Tax=Arthrobacter sp. H5 TaxID=1267973 RepID=UPI0004B320D1|nr:hypothetical protein [Arthrobacter sp. H5]